MIIREQHTWRFFITQPDHADLAARIMRAWRTDGFDDHPRRELILRAVREHDNGWIEEDATTLVDLNGQPLDFISAPVEVKHRIWPRAVARVAKRSPYEAALIAQHALVVHAQHRGDATWRPFFEHLEHERTAMLGGPLDERFEGDYRFLRAGDLLSLVFCNGWTEPHELPGGGRVALRDATLEVSPDPFTGERMPLRILARRLAAGSYASARDLRAALDAAPIEVLDGWAVGGPEQR